MQLKHVILAAVLATPYLSFGQQPAPNKSTTAVTKSTTAVTPAAKTEEKKTIDVTISSNAQKQLSTTTSTDSKKSEIASPAQAKLALAGNMPTAPGTAPASGILMPRPFESSSYLRVPLVGDMDYFGKNNKAVQDYTKTYLSNHGRRLAAMRVPTRGGKYFAIIDKVMDTKKMPREMKYLAVIESALNNNAVSPVGAVGPWQFMEGTARHMGMTVNGNRDDRRDWYKSTLGASKYLNYLYDIFDDWLLVVAAYNSGPRPVMNAISRTGKKDFFAIKKYLPKETQNHVMAFIAVATLMERMPNHLASGVPAAFNWNSLNFTNVKSGAKLEESAPANPLMAKFSEEELKKMAMIRIKSVIDLDLLSNLLNLDRRQIGKWNYDYYAFMDGFKAGDTYNLRIPKDKLDAFIEKKDYIERQSAKMRM